MSVPATIPAVNRAYTIVPGQGVDSSHTRVGELRWDDSRKVLVYRASELDYYDIISTGAAGTVDLSNITNLVLPGGIIFTASGSLWRGLHVEDLIEAVGIVVGTGDGRFRDAKLKSANGTIKITNPGGIEGDINLEVDPKTALPIPNGTRGDIVVTNDGRTLTVGPSAITNAKMADMGAPGVKGCVSEDGGSVANLTFSEVAAALPLFSGTGRGLVPPIPGTPSGARTLFDDGEWRALPAALSPDLLPKLSDITPSSINKNASGSSGSSPEAARIDHVHAVGSTIITVDGGRIEGLLEIVQDPAKGEHVVNRQYLERRLGTISVRGGPAPWTAPEPWQPSTPYVAAAPASCRTYKFGTYVCRVPHVSGPTFDPSKWEQIGYSTDKLVQELEVAVEAVGKSASALSLGEPMVVVSNAAGNVALDYRVNRCARLHVTGHLTSLSVANWPGPDRWAPMFLEIINPNGFNLAWPENTFWPNNATAPAFGAGRHLVSLLSTDAGASVYAMIPGQGFALA